jgi:endonuclease III
VKRRSYWERIDRSIESVYASPWHYNLREPTSELVFIVLSAQTAEAKYRHTFNALRSVFGSWGRVSNASVGSIARVIRSGGLERKKATQLKAALQRIQKDTVPAAPAGGRRAGLGT